MVLSAHPSLKGLSMCDKVPPDGPLTDLKASLQSGQVLLDHPSAALPPVLQKIISSAQCTVVALLSDYQKLPLFFYSPLLSKGLLHPRPISTPLTDHFVRGSKSATLSNRFPLFTPTPLHGFALCLCFFFFLPKQRKTGT